jgi:chromosome segregation ATPase
MNFARWLISLALILFSISASAEYYRYIDKDGNVHYTDDLTAVPENQRTDINEYNEIQSNVGDHQKDEEKAKTTETLIEEKQSETKQDAYDFSEIKKKLDRKKEQLEKEYKALMDEKKQFQEDKNKLKTRTAARKYNNAVLKLNEKIEDYQKRKTEFDAEVEHYNSQVEKSYLNELEKRKKAREEQ